MWCLVQPWEGEERGRGWDGLTIVHPLPLFSFSWGSSCVKAHLGVQVCDTGYYLIPNFPPHKQLQPCPRWDSVGPMLGMYDTTDFFRSEHISEEDEGEKKISFVMMRRMSTRDRGRLHLLLACSAIPTRQLQSWQLNQEGCVGENPRDGV